MPGPRHDQPTGFASAARMLRAMAPRLAALARSARGRSARNLIVLTIGGGARPVGLDLSRLARAGGGFRMSAGGLDFDLPAGRAVQLDAAGPLLALDGREVPLARISVRADAAPRGEVSLALVWTDDEGTVLGRSTLPINRRRRDWFIQPPLGANGAGLRLGLGGCGRLPRLDVAVEPVTPTIADRLGLARDGAQAANVTTPAHQAARTLFARRDYGAVIGLHEHAGLRTDMIGKLAFFSLVELRLFEEALAFHGRWAPDDETAHEWERRRLEALGNLGRWAEARRRIEARLDAPEDEGRPAMLIQGFAHTAADPRLRRRLIEAIAGADALPVGREPVLTDIANRCLFMPDQPAAARVFERVRDHRDLDRRDHHMLCGQKAFVQSDFVGQLGALNAMLGDAGLEPVDSGDLEAPLTLTGLRERPGREAAVDGPAVTVVMTAFNSAATIGYALGSLLRQTYAGLEIILVDDASTDDTVPTALAAAAAQGRCITVLRRDRNAGTYVCRNMGLARAGGRYVVMQDSDDWAHPRKIERLVAGISREPAVAVFARGLRLTPSEGFASRGGFVQTDGSSLLFEREAVLGRMGGYEPERIGADGEFHRRMERCFGQAAVRGLDAPLSMIAARPGSLSRGQASAIEPETGVFTRERNLYRQAYLRRHERPGADWMRPLSEEAAAFAA